MIFSFGASKYYFNICNAKSNDSDILSRCVRLTLNTKLGFFYVHQSA